VHAASSSFYTVPELDLFENASLLLVCLANRHRLIPLPTGNFQTGTLSGWTVFTTPRRPCASLVRRSDDEIGDCHRRTTHSQLWLSIRTLDGLLAVKLSRQEKTYVGYKTSLTYSYNAATRSTLRGYWGSQITCRSIARPPRASVRPSLFNVHRPEAHTDKVAYRQRGKDPHQGFGLHAVAGNNRVNRSMRFKASSPTWALNWALC
jgi:hypothetical protein